MIKHLKWVLNEFISALRDIATGLSMVNGNIETFNLLYRVRKNIESPVRQFRNIKEMFVELDSFIYKSKSLCNNKLREAFIKNIIEFLKENKIDGDQHCWVSIEKLKKWEA